MMDIEEFKRLIDNRDVSRFDEMWEPADKWAETQNKRDTESNLLWSFNSGLKLDYDGDLLSVLSRFYPPHKSSADFGKWHGKVTVIIGKYQIDESANLLKKEFEAETLDTLQAQVEFFVGQVERLSKEVLWSARGRFLSLLH